MKAPSPTHSLQTATRLTFAALLAMSSLAGAQAPDATSPSVQEEAAAPAVAVDDRKIDQFADAYVAVQQIQSQATQQLGATADADKAQQVKQEAETQMIEAVQQSGLQIEEFNQIVQAMASDPTLRDKISGRIDERKRTS